MFLELDNLRAHALAVFDVGGNLFQHVANRLVCLLMVYQRRVSVRAGQHALRHLDEYATVWSHAKRDGFAILFEQQIFDSVSVGNVFGGVFSNSILMCFICF